MNEPLEFSRWLKEGAESEPPPGFTDGVMDRIGAGAGGEHEGFARPGFLENLFSPGAVAAGLFALAFGLGAFRVGLLMLLVLFSSGKGV